MLGVDGSDSCRCTGVPERTADELKLPKSASDALKAKYGIKV